MAQSTPFESPSLETPVWSISRTYDTVVGGDEIFTLGETGLSIRHSRGFFLVYLGDICPGGIEKIFHVSPRQYFLANGIPYEGTLAQYHLDQELLVCDNECHR